ncbi:hypothetical protein ASG22_05785 [Chryseobacterium sp. Leaf405]|uniref:hypothetical protein n=1 Tax=Chryseobacterium sp. Leaf405 TaxID=1736367 RepID=UPI0006FA8245|nr:hypothetical protein [Chryseobacterium sp. Leaf405]KQT26180.1 hypothetical protein ASG22_05785 [Chryseobacterium sp. Leaf405]
MLKQNFEKFINNPNHERKAVLLEIDRLNNRLKIARSKLLENIIDNEEYFEVKKECKDQLEKLEGKLTKVEDKKKNRFTETTRPCTIEPPDSMFYYPISIK